MHDLFGKLKKPELKVLKELPQGAVERENLLLGLREASGEVNGEYVFFHYCPNCQGWIEGMPDDRHENNWAPHRLAGRMGVVYDCRRCGYELAFLGVMS